MSAKRWTDKFLNQMNHTGDDLADATVQVIFEKHDVKRINKLLQDLIEDDKLQLGRDDLHPQARKKLEHYLTESGKLPKWADPKRIKEGERLFENYGMIAFSLLGCASLPELYTCGEGGTQVLRHTLKLEKHVHRRIFETAQMVIDVMSEGGLDAEAARKDPERYGKGIRAAQRVRLMHAAVRQLILVHPTSSQPFDRPRNFGEALQNFSWQQEKWGVPIGQEYMGATLQTFSYVILRSLRKFGVKLDTQQEEAYIHCWNIVGHIMGVHEEFLVNVNNMEEAEALYEAVMKRKRSQTPVEAKDGRDLTEALLNFMGSMMKNQLPFGRFLPLGHIPKVMMMELIGKENADLLGVKLDFFDQLAKGPFYLVMQLWGYFETDISKHHGMAEWLFRVMAKDLWKMSRGSQRRAFEIPAHLAKTWALKKN